MHRPAARYLAKDCTGRQTRATGIGQDNKHVFDPHPILQDVIPKMTPAARHNKVQLVSDIEAGTARLCGELVMFEQAILNLIRNALLHGGPNLTEIRLAAGSSAGNYDIKMIDNGKGIAEEDFDHALGRFRQVGPGSGLGLPIAATVAEAMGGRLDLTRQDVGFCVTFSAPISELQEAGYSAARLC